MNDCSRFWDHADHIPLDDVISYWCELSGHSADQCRDAKRAAICSAVDGGVVKFRRKDGKQFDDDVYDLAARGQLLIEKDSFNAWTQQFSDAPAFAKPLEKRERDTLLAIIGILCSEAGVDYNKAAKSAAIISGSGQNLGVTIGETTIEGHLKKVADAMANRMK